MKMKKNIMFLFIAFFLTGCVRIWKDGPIYDTMRVDYKHDFQSPRGMVSACYKDKIYYFSDEMGASGVYCMDTDGENVHLILECDDLRRLQIVKDVIYIAELQKEKERQKPVYRLSAYSLDGKKLDDKITSDMLEFDNRWSGISDFYVNQEEQIFLNAVSYLINMPVVSKIMYYLTPEITAFYPSVYELPVNSEDTMFLYQLGNTYFITENEEFEEKVIPESYMYTGRYIYGYSGDDHTAWWNYDEWPDIRGNKYRIWGLLNDELIYTKENEIYSYNLDSGEITLRQKVLSRGVIVWLDINSDYLNIVTEAELTSVYSKRKDRSRQTLWRMDSSFFHIEKIKDYGNTGKVFQAAGDRLIDYDGTSIYIYQMDEYEITEEIWSYKLKDQVKNRGYTVDIAGDWLFIKYKSDRKGRAELKVKVRFLS